MIGRAFFSPDGPELVPHEDARSPWSDQMLHGRLLAALAARTLEREQLADGFRPARLTVDLFRAAPMRPVLITTVPVREGRRVRTAEARIVCEGHEVARASAVMLKTGEEPTGRVWAPAPWGAPPPDQVESGPRDPGDRFPMDLRPVGEGGFGHLGPKALWVRETRDLVEGEENTGFVRAAGAADLANPFSHSGENGLEFINADLNVHLARLPVGEWVGLDVAFRVSDSGVAVGGCDLYDEQGPIGACSVASVANTRLSV